jgi:glycosyltransferase involved in cell wall biosynthesis
LVSDIPANREVLGAQLDNQLFGPSPEEFASALQNLIEKKENWSFMGQANRADLLARHWEKAEQIWIQTLQNVLK